MNIENIELMAEIRRLEVHVSQLESELERKNNVISDQADQIAVLKLQLDTKKDPKASSQSSR